MDKKLSFKITDLIEFVLLTSIIKHWIKNACKVKVLTVVEPRLLSHTIWPVHQ